MARSAMGITGGWSIVRQRLRNALTGRPPAPTSSATNGRVPVRSPAELLAHPERLARLQAIEALTRVTPAHFEVLYRSALSNYASYVQQLPASEAHHHSGLGGLLDHGLEAAVFALKLRRGHLLPPGAPTELIDAQADLWSYACFTAVLLHDIGKPAVDQVVTLFDKRGGELGPWDPWSGPMQAQTYEARFVRNRNYQMHQRAAPLLARLIVPPQGFRWLASEREVLAAWLAVISGMPEDVGPLGQIVEEADRLSTAADLTGGLTRQTPAARVRPLHERLVTGLRYLIDRGALQLNRPDAAGWLVGDELWLVVKTALDALRAHLLQEGQSGIPIDNRRLMDELQQRSVLISNGDRAVWSARITLGAWQQDLMLLRFPVSRLWPDSAIRPDTCQGTIQPLAGTNVAEAPETLPSASQSVMDKPPPRVMPAPTSPRASEPPEPAVASPEPRAAVGAPPSPVATVTEAPTSTKPTDLGQAFLAWLKAGLASGTLPINTVNARVHRVKEGVLLVSPGIFRDYGIAVQAPWSSIQKRFQKLRLHRKTPEGFNIWNYTVVGERRTRELKGVLVDDPEKALGPDLTLPPPNVHVVLVGRKNE
ncbi:MAG: MobH family relaxase [Gammaproteobacteria bacterium]